MYATWYAGANCEEWRGTEGKVPKVEEVHGGQSIQSNCGKDQSADKWIQRVNACEIREMATWSVLKRGWRKFGNFNDTMDE